MPLSIFRIPNFFNQYPFPLKVRKIGIPLYLPAFVNIVGEGKGEWGGGGGGAPRLGGKYNYSSTIPLLFGNFFYSYHKCPNYLRPPLACVSTLPREIKDNQFLYFFNIYQECGEIPFSSLSSKR